MTALLNQVLGIYILTIHKKELEINGDFPPKSVKKTVSGSGNSTKLELSESVKNYVNLPEGFEFTNFDESDSVAVALTYLIKEGLIQAPVI